MGEIKTGHFLLAGAILHPTRAASARRFAAAFTAAPTAGLDALAAAAEREVRGAPPGDDPAALRRLLAEDLLALLAHHDRVVAAIAPWRDPVPAILGAFADAITSLGALGIELDPPRLNLARRLPPPYDHPSLWAISADRSDASTLGLEPGIHIALERAFPLAAEMALGHVLVHAALGERSPESLGRGLEEGICEVLGALHAAAAVAPPAAIAAAFDALRNTPTLLPHREELLGWTRAAALLHRRHGLSGLGRVVSAGRPAIKRLEAALGRGRTDEVELAAGAPDAALAGRLDALLARPRPAAVRPLAFYLCRALAAGRDVAGAARDLGVPPEAASEAARELMDRAFVLVLDPGGRVLADDLALVLGNGALRYAIAGAG